MSVNRWWAQPTLRSGATLTEILMAILIMGVGVVSVFTLFPISVLRTIQATNQTNAKILKENVEEQVAQSPIVLTQFSASTNPAPVSPVNGLTMRGEWQPGQTYNNNELVVPSVKPGTALRSLAFFRVNTPGTSNLVEPQWQATGQTRDGDTVIWDRFAITRYVVDPLGLNTARADGQTADVVDTFGNKTNVTTGVPSALGTPLLRIHGGLTHPTDVNAALFRAADVCTHPDSWQQAVQATPVSVTATSATFPATTDLTGLGGSALSAPRIVLTTSDGKQTVVRTLDGAPVGQTVDWDDDLPTRFERPPGSGNFDVGQARIEIFNRRYSWFMTVRNVGARPEIKCVVTFNRGFASAEEHAYSANFGNTAADLDRDGNADSTQGLTATNQVMIAWQPGAATAWDPEGTGPLSNEPEPLLKPGNWIFDARDVSWYRIQSVDSESATTATPRWKVITLDRSVRVQTSDDGSGPPPVPSPVGRAILIPGIVEIFDL